MSDIKISKSRISSISPEDAFKLLENQLNEISIIKSSIALMEWDRALNLPNDGFDSRGKQIAGLEKYAHTLLTSEDYGNLINACLENKHLDFNGILPVLKSDFEKALKVPADFSEKVSLHINKSYEAWKKARSVNEFNIISDILKETIQLSLEMSDYLKSPGNLSPLDPLIDRVEPGLTVAKLQPIFITLRNALIPLIQQSLDSQKNNYKPNAQIMLKHHYPTSGQLLFGKKLIEKIGFNFNKGRLDPNDHPFMIRIGNSDIRIAYNTNENDLSEVIFGTLHESGHAIYEQGISSKFEGTPLAKGTSSGVHESQSRLWENILGRSLNFWKSFYPQLQSTFPAQLKGVPIEEFYQSINYVQPSLIRMDADELTYNLHVMIRFGLEADLLENRLDVKDLPDAWADHYKTELGVTPNDLSTGVLQDVHWFDGLIGGNFQSYTIGNILSAQFYSAAQKEIQNLDEKISNGDFIPICNWLNQNIHQYGRLIDGQKLLLKVTGKDIDPGDYINYLKTKYPIK